MYQNNGGQWRSMFAWSLFFPFVLWSGHVSGLLIQPRRLPAVASASPVQPQLVVSRSGPEPMCQKLINMESHSTVEISVGTPPQKFELVADTGSGALIVQSCLCRELKLSSECKEEEDCFLGTPRPDHQGSSTFIGPEKNKSMRLLSFGSGDIIAAVATDVVRLGKAKATMKDGLLLMVDRELAVGGTFEGILGLGVPTWIETAKRPPKIKGAKSSNKAIKDHSKDWEQEPGGGPPPPRFLEEASIERFSICMDRNGDDGALMLNAEPTPKMLKQVGYHHWALHFKGFSVGTYNAPVAFCDQEKKEHWQEIACAAIPDSGTTLMLGPPKQINKLYVELCKRWPRCQEHIIPSDPRPETAFRSLVNQCQEWVDQSIDGIGEIPSVFAHLGGTDGESQTLELTSWSYIAEVGRLDGSWFCEPMFGEWEYETALQGPLWIFGTPLFFEFEVVFDSGTPDTFASVGFAKTTCGDCENFIPERDYEAAANKAANTTRFSAQKLKGRRKMRKMPSKPRMPSFKPTGPL